jgi:hypothetical protein
MLMSIWPATRSASDTSSECEIVQALVQPPLDLDGHVVARLREPARRGRLARAAPEIPK